MTYSKEELQEMLKKMNNASAVFYSMATHTGCHTFIEFTGLMNEYIQVCQQTMEAGKDFTEASAHGGGELLVHDYNLEYMAEKFTCIFETTLQDPKMMEIFLKAVHKKTGTQQIG